MAIPASLLSSFDGSSVLKLKGPCHPKSCWAAGNGIVSMTGLAATSGAEEEKGSVCHVRVTAHRPSHQTFTQQEVSFVSQHHFKLLKCNSKQHVGFIQPLHCLELMNAVISEVGQWCHDKIFQFIENELNMVKLKWSPWRNLIFAEANSKKE